MKTFTTGDLDSRPFAVLDACDAEGQVSIRRSDGRTYTVHADRPQSAKARPRKRFKVPDLKARWAKLGMDPIPEEQFRAVDKLIAGE